MLAQNCWLLPEYAFEGPTTLPVALGILSGDMGMSPEDIQAISAYMAALPDTHRAIAPNPYKAKK